MIRAAIVGLGRWGRSLVASVAGKSDEIGFVPKMDSAQANLRRRESAHERLVAGTRCRTFAQQQPANNTAEATSTGRILAKRSCTNKKLARFRFY
jgi:hypothetical protein